MYNRNIYLDLSHNKEDEKYPPKLQDRSQEEKQFMQTVGVDNTIRIRLIESFTI